jgi:HAMP domain-containing protein
MGEEGMDVVRVLVVLLGLWMILIGLGFGMAPTGVLERNWSALAKRAQEVSTTMKNRVVQARAARLDDLDWHFQLLLQSLYMLEVEEPSCRHHFRGEVLVLHQHGDNQAVWKAKRANADDLREILLPR